MLPILDGIKICRQLRQDRYQSPILMLTGKEDTNMHVTSLEAGADDYIVKPFDVSELIARIRALLRRSRAILTTVLTWEKLQLDTNTKEVNYAHQRLHLTPKEYGLLEIFLQNPHRIFSRSVLLDRIWSSGEFPGEEAVTTQIKGLRQKLKAIGMTADLIETVYGLGYRLKQEEKSTLHIQTISSSDLVKKRQAEANIMAIVAEMREELLKSLGEKFQVLELAIVQLASVIPEEQIIQQAKIEAHRLAGSLGCYGYPEGSKIAREMEYLLEKHTLSSQDTSVQLTELVKLLKQTLQQQPFSPVTPQPSTMTSARLLIIDDDRVLTERLRLEAVAWGFHVEVAANPKTARTLIALNCPDVVLLDLSFADDNESGLTFLAELSQNQPEIPVLVFTSNNQLSKRIEAARLGAHSFLQKTMSGAEVLTAVHTALSQSTITTNTKILIVDDDLTILNQVSSLLSPWGLQVTTLSNPQKFWEVLESTRPELLILDIEMPYFNGIEICQAVRNDHLWSPLPVLFLSAHTDIEILYQVYAVGGDDYIKKPIVEPELISRVLNRLERSRLRQKLGNKH
jgi:DNA-binding response OmpR family regulator